MGLELRLAGISTLEEANQFLREHYIDVFNRKFAVGAEQKGSAFRRTSRPDLDWVFTVQTERMATVLSLATMRCVQTGRMVATRNTVATAERVYQIEKARFRAMFSGCTVATHAHPGDSRQ